MNFENKITGGAVSKFSTWGPTLEVDVKPQFGAPGGTILSTYINGSYAVFSGTSMSCPFTAGAIALLVEARGTSDPAIITNLLSASANAQLFNDATSWFDYLSPVPQQGAGLIQVYDAAHATTILSPSSVSFNDTANFAPGAKHDHPQLEQRRELPIPSLTSLLFPCISST